MAGKRSKTIAVRMGEKQYAKLSAIAKNERRSLSDMARWVIEQWLDEEPEPIVSAPVEVKPVAIKFVKGSQAG